MSGYPISQKPSHPLSWSRYGMSRVSPVAVLPVPTFVEMAKRYATPLPQLTDEVAMLAVRVEEHLKKMGFQS